MSNEVTAAQCVVAIAVGIAAGAVQAYLNRRRRRKGKSRRSGDDDFVDAMVVQAAVNAATGE